MSPTTQSWREEPQSLKRWTAENRMVQSRPVRPLTRDYGKGRPKLARKFDPSGAPSSPALETRSLYRYENNVGDSAGTGAELMRSRGGGAELEAFEALRPQDCQQAENPGG